MFPLDARKECVTYPWFWCGLSVVTTRLWPAGDVIGALSGKSKHVPYRNSKLTYLLADSLGGESKCLMFVNVSPAAVNAAESINSLGFAARCRATELGQAKKNVTSGA